MFPVESCIFPIFGVVCVETHRAFNPEKSYFIFAQNPLIYTFLHQNYYMYHLNVKKRKILPGFSLLYFGEFFRGKYTTGNAEQLWKLICSGNYAMCYLHGETAPQLFGVLPAVEKRLTPPIEMRPVISLDRARTRAEKMYCSFLARCLVEICI